MGKLSAYQPRLQPREAQICIWDVTRSKNKVKLNAKTKQKIPSRQPTYAWLLESLSWRDGRTFQIQTTVLRNQDSYFCQTQLSNCFHLNHPLAEVVHHWNEIKIIIKKININMLIINFGKISKTKQ
jgi:DNA-directed RNA polymerase specialized sigma54-like protein